MILRDLLTGIIPEGTLPDHPAWTAEIKDLNTNSLACQPGDLFIGMPGTRVDGGEFAETAIAAGAVAAIVSPQAATKLKAGDLCIIPVPDVVTTCAHVATRFFGQPTQQLQLVGVTGTNGKTTTTHLIDFFLAASQQPTALLGTLYTRWPGFQQTAVHTTPFAVELQRQLAAAVTAGCGFGVMEVSSHALAQNRVLGCEFAATVFTNLTQDHLDFHPSMEDYFAAKARLFGPPYRKGRAIVNQDDPYGQRLIAQLPADQVWRYSVSDAHADLWMSDLAYGATGVAGQLHTPQGTIAFQSPLVGQFNLANLLAAIGAGLHFGLDLAGMVQALPGFPGVPGRMQQVRAYPEQDITVIVDYAHTPDSLENLLKAARPFIQGDLICVFGCGGDRDRTKRPQMGRIAATLADQVVVTSDNPRTEDPERILADILTGIPDAVSPTVMPDRARAIRTAILQAKPGDGVLIAGKGHEDYQILGTEKIHFDDREQASDALTVRRQGTIPI